MKKRWSTLIFIIVCHGLLLCLGSFERSADGWIHLFFADHWQNSWLNDWEMRWNSGFSVFSYPPLAHQILAIVGWALGWQLTAILVPLTFFGILLWGVFRFSRCWMDDASSWMAVLLTASLSSMGIALHVFGHLPNILALALLFHALPFVRAWLLEGKRRDFGPSILLVLSSALCNLYAGVFGFALLALPMLLESWGLNKLATLKRGSLLLLFGSVLGVFLLAPTLYFQTVYQADAVPVFHSSRANIVTFKAFNWFMFYGQYGIYLLLLPFWLFNSWKEPIIRRFLPTVLLLGILSLGGSTPLARWIMGPLFEQITFDRFGQWNSLILSVLLGGWLTKKWRLPLWRPVLGVMLGLHLGAGIYSATTLFWQPLPLLRKLDGVVAWMKQEPHQQYRYLTLGLHRANFAKLSTLVPNQSLDGNFPFARNLAVLNASGIASLDDARQYGPSGYTFFQQVLQQAPALHLKYILSAESDYDAILLSSGWHQETRLDDLQIWVRDGIPPLSNSIPVPSPLGLRVIWAFAPLLLGFLASISCYWVSRDSDEQGVQDLKSA
jgi:hypothetical protein